MRGAECIVDVYITQCKQLRAKRGHSLGRGCELAPSFAGADTFPLFLRVEAEVFKEDDRP